MRTTGNLRQRLGTVLLALGLFISTLLLSPAQADQVVETYDIPGYSSGLAWDGNLLWIGGIGANGRWIRAFDPELGQVVDSIRAPVADCIGLAWIGNRLAYISPRSDSTFFVSRDGFDVAFGNPQQNMGGLGVDGMTFWSSTYSDLNGTLLQLDVHGEVLRSMPFSGRHSRDMAYHFGRVYVTDRLAQEIRVVNPESGRFIRTFPTPGINPDGLTSDGDFLWLLDDGDNKASDRLYKILISPDGNIRLSSLKHNFESVIINQQVVWDLWIFNDGDRVARLTDFVYEAGNPDIITAHDWAFPREIVGGDSARLRFSFEPAFSDSVHIRYGLTYDVDNEQVYWVDLRGKGVAPRRDILIHDRTLEFGSTRCGEFVRGSNMRYLHLENNGGETLTLEDIRFSNESFSSGYYELPYEFTTPGLYKIPIFFKPNRDLDLPYDESMTIFSDDPDSPVIRVGLTGTSRLANYNGGQNLWVTQVGGREELPVPRVRSIHDIDDVTADGLADIVVASNDFKISAYHAAATDEAIAIWTYETNQNPWRSGSVHGQRGLSEGDDWDGDGVHDLVFGLEGGAMQIIALSGRTGRELWIFDTHQMQGGGGDVVITSSEMDFNGDDVLDVYAAVAGQDNQNSTNAAMVINGLDGQIIWQDFLAAMPIDMYTIPDFTGDGIDDFVVLLDNGTVQGIDGSRGRVVWENEIEGTIVSMFPLDGDVNDDGSVDIAFVTYMNGFLVINGSNGVILWHVQSNGYYENLRVGIPLNDLNGNGSPDFIFGDDNVIRAIDGRTSESAWDTTTYVGSPTLSLAPLIDFDEDGLFDYVAGTASGRLYAFSGNGVDGLWSYSNAGEGHGFVAVIGTRDIDGNGSMDVFGAMENGTVYAFAGSWVGDIMDDETPSTPSVNVPSVFMVDAAYPNPFNSTVAVPVHLLNRENLNVRVVNILGREVYQQSTPSLAPGTHRLVWHGNTSQGMPLPSGMYFMEIQSVSNRFIRPVELLR